ncbi:hypothetical protein [Flavobacterium phycosphaerae]|uniref:hypothetical protein n=1 Tax=Flavobacterium phycosphaerae TaxID=2697515 RepID=UPI00138B125E|nr:hypothetical protein [Flavobacterium phycosphaerae]
MGAGISEFRVLEPNKIVQQLLTFVESEISAFNMSDEFVEILSVKKNENQHSLSFCVFMTNQCQSKFYFARENAQSGSSVIDIGVYFGAILIFTFEAKLLPTPIPKNSSRVEHEYVYGKGAGIQRFRDGRHGRDNSNNYLQESGLLAFILKDDFDFWLDKINQWIMDAKWNESEKLNKIYFGDYGKLLSKHTRLNQNDITLHHFWINLS